MALLEVADLRTHLTSRRGVNRAVDGVSFKLDTGKSLGIVGESGSGKSMTALSILRLVPQPYAKIVGGSIRFDGEDLLEEIRARDAARSRRQHRDHPAGPDRQPQSGVQHRLPDRRIGPNSSASVRRSATCPRDRQPAARAGSHARGSREGLSAPVQRRHAPARRGGDRHRMPAQAPDRRRGDDRARYHDPGAIPRPPPHATARAQSCTPVHYARFRDRRQDVRRRRCDVCGPDCRTCRGARDLQPAGASLHRGTARGRPEGRRSRRSAECDPRRAVERLCRAAGLSVCAALRSRHRSSAMSPSRRSRRSGPGTPPNAGARRRYTQAKSGSTARADAPAKVGA